MPDFSTCLLFIAASLALILVPGMGQAMVLARTLAGGPVAGVCTAVGLNLGTLFHAAAAAFGLSAILATSAAAFAIVKYAGAAYLVWLGVRALREGPTTAKACGVPVARRRAVLGQALVAGILNPKVAIFFLAFLPQFVDPARGPVVTQFLFLGATIALLDLAWELVLVGVVTRFRDKLRSGDRWRRLAGRVSGVVLVGLGARLALQER